MQPHLLTVLFVNLFDHFVSSVYFELRHADEKCFLEELRNETGLTGRFRIRLNGDHKDFWTNQDLRMFIEVRGPDDELVLSQWSDSEGTFRFTSQKPGRHQICLQSAGGSLIVQLDNAVGKSTKGELLSALQVRIQQLSEQVQQIQRELDHQRMRMKHFQNINQSTNMWIYWWPFARSLYIVAFILWITSTW